jgi:hypothetical protein
MDSLSRSSTAPVRVTTAYACKKMREHAARQMGGVLCRHCQRFRSAQNGTQDVKTPCLAPLHVRRAVEGSFTSWVPRVAVVEADVPAIAQIPRCRATQETLR